MYQRQAVCCILRIAILLFATQVLTSTAQCQESAVKVEWNRFRGPNGSGVHSTANVPVDWSNDKNIRWKLPLDGPGKSSPVVVGDRVFLTGHSAEPIAGKGFSKHLLCIDLRDGQVIWKKDIVRTNAKPDEKKDYINSGFAPHTVASDGKHVYAYFGNDGLFSFNFDGEQTWHLSTGDGEGTRDGAMKGFLSYGTASSPILYRDFVIQNAGVESGRLLAVHKATGTQAWSVTDAALRTTLSTPIVASTDKGDELVIQMNGKLVGLDPMTGKELWQYPYRKTEHAQITSPTVVGEIVFASPSYYDGIFAVPIGERGNLEGKELWDTLGSPLVSSPLVTDGQIHLFENSSFLTTYSVKDGEQLREVRTKLSPGAKFYASPVRIGNHWMILASDGQSFVWPVQQSPKSNPVDPIVNELKEKDPYFAATPAVTDSEILIRSDQFLYCISKQ